MDRNDRDAIDELFAKLADVEGRTGPRDAEAEAFIRQRVAAQPAASYYMAQTIIVQEQALAAAERRIEELERQTRERPGLLGGLFGQRASGPASRPMRGYRSVPNYGPPTGGGGFLAGAAQTALGVAGGLLVGSMIAGAFGGSEAEAAEAQDQDTGDAGDAGDAGGGDFGGGDFGGGDGGGGGD